MKPQINTDKQKKEIMLGKLADEYMVKLQAGEKLSVNDWVKAHPEVPADELRQQLQMGVLLTKVGQTGWTRPTLSDEQRNRIKANTLAYYDEVMGGKKAESAKADGVPANAGNQAKQAYDLLDQAAKTFGNKDYPATRELLTKAIALHEKLKNNTWLGFEHSILGFMAHLEDKWSEAIDHYKKSGLYYQSAGESKGQVGVLAYLGLVYYQTGDYDHARRPFRQALEIAQKINYNQAVIETAVYLGLIELSQGNYRPSFAYTKQALDTAETMNDKHTMAVAYANMAEAAEEGRGHKTAIELYTKSLELSRAGKFYDLIAQTANRIAALYASHHKWDDAATCANEALAALDELRGASKHPAAVTFRRAMGAVGLQAQDEFLTDFRRRLNESRTQMAQI